ncbi:putative CRISPR-associated protein [Sulfurisphaera tokodaii str. 7]|uniref:CRISPR-associated protein n=1 Tax=Sulfurisphaera tokodaii (strain DSM 16993 / JCM 10545 / NBRC 100140 / 7) TaxID=273063 RepID=Q977B0_SULTO|nr:CRISPR-associated endonuclease Cas3'' [Sulfurisphaera tokodaii]BAB64984.1 putative CRISPR-associated protein [Sulfurisphaera tokodaii str. 7]
MTCWAFYGKETFKDHALGTLNCFRNNFEYIIPILSKRSGEKIENVRKSIEIAVAFHDIGKASKKYINSYYGHELYSGYIISRIIRNCCDNKLRDIVALAAMSHHQAMVERGLELIKNNMYVRIPQFEFNEECKGDINEVAKEIKVSIDIDLTYITPNDVVSWLLRNKHIKEFYYYPIVLGPLMICDTYTAYQHRSDTQYENILIREYKRFLM